jgi:hypothetical protein
MNLMKKLGRVSVAALLLPVLASLAAAQPAMIPADAVVEAAELSVTARGMLSSCRYADAEKWFKKAGAVLRDRSVRAGEAGAAGNLSARLQIQLADLQSLRHRLDTAYSDISRLLAGGQLARVRARLGEVDAPQCDARFVALKLELAEREYKAAHPSTCSTCRRIGKIVLWSVIMGGASYGGYLAYDKYGHPVSQPSVLRPPTR